MPWQLLDENYFLEALMVECIFEGMMYLDFGQAAVAMVMIRGGVFLLKNCQNSKHKTFFTWA